MTKPDDLDEEALLALSPAERLNQAADLLRAAEASGSGEPRHVQLLKLLTLATYRLARMEAHHAKTWHVQASAYLTLNSLSAELHHLSPFDHIPPEPGAPGR